MQETVNTGAYPVPNSDTPDSNECSDCGLLNPKTLKCKEHMDIYNKRIENGGGIVPHCDYWV